MGKNRPPRRPSLVRYEPSDGRWEVLPTAGNAATRAAFGDAAFEQSRLGLKKFLCEYFSNGDCSLAQGKSICPIAATPAGGKILKVRWALPGCGKSGGLRLAVVVYCKERKVVIADAFIRSDDPPTQAFLDATSGLE